MNARLILSLVVIVVLLTNVGGATAHVGAPAPAAPQAAIGTGFTYQGQIDSNGSSINGTCDFQFTLYDGSTGGTQIGATQTSNSVNVTNGLFTVSLDFGSNAFNGDARWLEMAARCPAGGGGYTTLTPRQSLAPAPYALALPGLYTQQNMTSTNIIGGFSRNNVAPGVTGATIGGGGANSLLNTISKDFGTIGGGSGNTVAGPYGTIGGGILNGASGNYSTIGGGLNSNATGNVATVSGGQHNSAANAIATVGGGFTNAANGYASTISGGENNTASGTDTTVGGGYRNSASGLAATVGGGKSVSAAGAYGTVPGGAGNAASGDFSFAAGDRARANHQGAFVWADSTNADINSSGNDQFIVRANGGMWVGQATTDYTPTIGANVMISTSTGAYLSSDGTWVNSRPSKTPQQIAMLKWYTAISTTQTNFPVAWEPVGIAFDGTNMWVANQNTQAVSVIRISDGATVGYYPMNVPGFLAYDGANMWITNYTANTVSVLRARDGFRVMTPTVGTNPGGIAFDGTNMWIVNTIDNTVSVLRASDGFHVMTPTVGVNPSNIAYDGTNMWVTNHGGNYGNTVSVLRASDGFNVMTPTVGSWGAGPAGIAFDGVNMWVANFGGGGGNTVSVLRASDGVTLKTITVGTGARGLAFDGTNMWVSHNSLNTVSVLRASDGTLVSTVTAGSRPWEIAFDGANMWITNLGDGTVSKR